MAKRLRVGVLYGGRSGEHEISLRSARAVIRALDPARYEVVPIAITRNGRWFAGPDSLARLERAQRRLRHISAHGVEVTILPEPTRRGLLKLGGGGLERLDVVFPVLHGTYGEDGTIQGLLELAGMPYVGAGVLGSAIGMDKDVAKRLMREAGLPVAPFIAVRGEAATDASGVADRIAEARLGYPCFVKPANLGSSVGISRVARAEELPRALAEACRYDTKLVIEGAVTGREFEIAVLAGPDSGAEPAVSVPGEVIPGRTFYDYVDKYVDDSARTIVPAPLSPDRCREITRLARRTCQVLECSGMARVDFFLRRDGEALIVNEINTIPGFTAISLFPRMWKASGVPPAKVVDRLIAHALARHARRRALETSFTPHHIGTRAALEPRRAARQVKIARRPANRRGRRRSTPHR